MSTEDRIRKIASHVLSYLLITGVIEPNGIGIKDVIDFESTLASGTLTFKIEFLIENYSGKSMQKKDLLEISNSLFDSRIYDWFLESINDILLNNGIEFLIINRYKSPTSVDYRFYNGKWKEEFPF